MLKSVIFVCLLYVGTHADFVAPVGISACTSCCSQLGLTGDSLDKCITAGCNRVPATTCGENFALGTDERVGCEFGRDFRFAGYSLGTGSLVQCLNSGLDLNAILPEIVNFNDLPQQNRNQCDACCLSLNRATDSGDVLSQPDDFLLSACQNNCIDNDVCFDEVNHRTRVGCLVALDLLHEALVSFRNQVFTCENGVVRELEITNFPTVSPTINPTGSPITDEPTTSPTRNPTISPTTLVPTGSPTTLAPTETPTTNPTSNPTSSPTNQPTNISTLNPTISPTFTGSPTSVEGLDNDNEGDGGDIFLQGILIFLVTCLVISVFWMVILVIYLLVSKELGTSDNLSRVSAESMDNMLTRVASKAVIQKEQNSPPVIVNVTNPPTNNARQHHLYPTRKITSPTVKKPGWSYDENDDDLFSN